MKKFKIEVSEQYWVTYEVTANSEDEAREAFNDGSGIVKNMDLMSRFDEIHVEPIKDNDLIEPAKEKQERFKGISNAFKKALGIFRVSMRLIRTGLKLVMDN